jgi:hypothetical protein
MGLHGYGFIVRIGAGDLLLRHAHKTLCKHGGVYGLLSSYYFLITIHVCTSTDC